jgi:ABC-type polar amino acid transport system ATPase subunit
MKQPLLHVENLVKKLGRSVVLNNVSFSLRPNESLLIQGVSGCGKTTLLRCIALLEKIDRGQIVFNGQIVSKLGYVRHPSETAQVEVAMVFQQLYLWSHMTVIENVSLPLWLRNGRNKKLANELSIQKLAELGIENKASSYPSQLSGGQKQRVALARALVHSPKLLLLDEITANLDPETAHQALKLVEHIVANGTSVILVSHDRISSDMWSSIMHFDGYEWIKK